MIPALRHAFNAAWTESQYKEFLRLLQSRVRGSIDFPISETPCFFPRSLMRELADAGAELTRQAMTGDAAAAAAAVVPERFHGPNQGNVPLCVQVDFGLVRGQDVTLEPKLVELQAFPSLYGFQIALAEGYREGFSLSSELDSYLDDLSGADYHALVRTVIVGDHDPANVVLMEIEPAKQKTRPDFAMTEQHWGVRAVDTNDVIRDGRRLMYRRDGQDTPISRIYNRVIPDEVERKQVTLPFDYRDDLDVEWVGHPAWYFRISKFSIPWLRHRTVPRTWFLHEVEKLPDARERLLLKPLFSFAGGGIVFEPSDEQLAAIPQDKRSNYILQERLTFEPVIETPHGPTQAEIRIMYVWANRLRAVLPLVRMGRGKMMGVDHNKGLRWVGASAALMDSAQ